MKWRQGVIIKETQQKAWPPCYLAHQNPQPKQGIFFFFFFSLITVLHDPYSMLKRYKQASSRKTVKYLMTYCSFFFFSFFSRTSNQVPLYVVHKLIRDLLHFNQPNKPKSWRLPTKSVHRGLVPYRYVVKTWPGRVTSRPSTVCGTRMEQREEKRGRQQRSPEILLRYSDFFRPSMNPRSYRTYQGRCLFVQCPRNAHAVFPTQCSSAHPG